jgi:hypothetical protein
VEQNEKIYFLPKLANYIFTTSSFGLWMPKGAHDIFVLVINFLGYDWQLLKMTIDLFEATETIGETLVNNLIE